MEFVLVAVAACLVLVLVALRAQHVRRAQLQRHEREVTEELARAGARLRERLEAAQREDAAAQ